MPDELASAPATRTPCRLPRPIPRPLPPGLSGPRLSAIGTIKPKWLNGTQLTYHFLANARSEEVV